MGCAFALLLKHSHILLPESKQARTFGPMDEDEDEDEEEEEEEDDEEGANMEAEEEGVWAEEVDDIEEEEEEEEEEEGVWEQEAEGDEEEGSSHAPFGLAEGGASGGAPRPETQLLSDLLPRITMEVETSVRANMRRVDTAFSGAASAFLLAIGRRFCALTGYVFHRTEL